jgi:hypothetical protein
MNQIEANNSENEKLINFWILEFLFKIFELYDTLEVSKYE